MPLLLARSPVVAGDDGGGAGDDGGGAGDDGKVL